MRKIHFIAMSRRNLNHFVTAAVLAFIIISINMFFFTDIESPIKAASSIFGLQDAGFLADSGVSGKLAIVIDDFGQNRNGVKEMMSIKRHLTFAVMPFLAFSESDAEKAHENGHEVIVHLPMESYNANLSWVGPRPILAVMGDNEIQEIVSDSFASVPYAVGANIHMGAKVGGDERVISTVLNIIKSKKVYFLDSRSTKKPIAKKVAEAKGVICYERDVFLDSNKTKTYVKKQLEKAADLALKKGYAIAIGHVGTEGGKTTAQAITEMLPVFDQKNVELVYVSELGN